MTPAEFAEKYPDFNDFLLFLYGQGVCQEATSDVLYSEGVANQCFSLMANYIASHFSGDNVLSLILNYLHQLINDQLTYTITTDQQLAVVGFISSCIVSIPQ